MRSLHEDILHVAWHQHNEIKPTGKRKKGKQSESLNKKPTEVLHTTMVWPPYVIHERKSESEFVTTDIESLMQSYTLYDVKLLNRM